MSGPEERRYQVFVSSTFEDLKPEREKVLQAVLEIRAFPAGMELFPSADDEQWSFIKREIESSDYYLLITAGKYGSLAPDGISFTEKEYDYAVSLRKYVMSFVRKDLSKVLGGQLETADEGRKKLEAFREKVSKSKLVRFYENPDELKSQVIQALAHAFQFKPQEGWVRAKNARRIEDLEELMRLQKRVMELEAENLKLVDPTAPYAQGEEVLEWRFPLLPARMLGKAQPELGKPPVLPPAEAFTFTATWDQLLAAMFAGAETQVDRETLQIRLRAAVVGEIGTSFPGSAEWGALANQMYFSRGYVPSGAGIEDESFRKFVMVVRRQCQGLDLIEEDTVQRGSFNGSPLYREMCRLTRKGRLQLLAVEGVQRASAASE